MTSPQTKKDNLDAIRRGREARIAGKNIHACPYNKFSTLRSHWCVGWREEDLKQFLKEQPVWPAHNQPRKAAR
jgi:ribosome modulation factor